MERHQLALIEGRADCADDAQVTSDQATNFQHLCARYVSGRGLHDVGTTLADLRDPR
jgi:hypothetical protein